MQFSDTVLSEKGIFETILARRSVRDYTSQTITRSLINILLAAAVHAPTAMHEEPRAFVIVQNKNQLKKISEQAKPLFIEEQRYHQGQTAKPSFTHFTHPDFDIFHDAGTLIIICAIVASQFAAADCWLAAENLMLAACGMGIGTCVIGSAVTTLNLDTVKQNLGIPSEYSAIVPIIVGIPSGSTSATPRHPPRILRWHD